MNMKKRLLSWLMSMSIILGMVVFPTGAVEGEAQVVYVLGGYEVETTDAYGNCVTNIYAQGVDMDGKELSVLVGIEYEAESMVDLGLINGWDISAGYYTFNLSADKDEKKAGIMVATALNTSWDADYEDGFYTASVASGTAMKSDDGRITTSEGLAYITDTTKIILVEGGLGEELKTAVLNGSITKTLHSDVPVILSQDEYGNQVLETMIILDVIDLWGEDYIFVSTADAAAAAIVGVGLIEVEAWFTKSGEKKTIVVDCGWLDGGMFYEYSFRADDECYDLCEAYVGEDLRLGEIFERAYAGRFLISSGIAAYDTSEAKIIDTRSTKELEKSDVAEIATLGDMADAKLAEYVVEFAAVVDDEEEIVENIFITAVWSENGDEGGSADKVILTPETGVLPAKSQLPNNIAQVTAVAQGQSITLEGLGELSNAPGNDVVDEYLGVAVGDWVVITRQEERYVLDPAGLKVMEGVITTNQACGEAYTVVYGVNYECYFNIVTDLDMLGRYVRVYYQSQYKNEREPGVVYGLEDLGTTIRVSEPMGLDTSAEYRAVFGKNCAVSENVLTFDGRYNMTVRGTINGYDSGVCAPNGTYVIYDGQIVSYLAPLNQQAAQVVQVNNTAGNEFISVLGWGRMSNNAADDIVFEYDGVAKGDVVIVSQVQWVYYLTKATPVVGQITRTAVDKNGNSTITVNGTTYTMFPAGAGSSGLANTSFAVDFDKIYEIYTVGDKYIGWKSVVAPVSLADVVYVLGGYEVTTTDAYGNYVTNVYAQGVDMDGKEVSVLVGIEYAAESMEDLGLINGWDISAGYYTFKLSADKDEKKAGIMVATALNDFPDEDYGDNLYTAYVHCVDMKSSVDKIITSHGIAYIADSTKIILVEGGLGEELKSVVVNGAIKKTIQSADVILSQDQYGNQNLEAMVIVDIVDLQAEDYIFVSDADAAAAATVGAGEIEIEAWFTKSGEKRTIVVYADRIHGDCFFEYTYDVAEGIYDLCEVTGDWYEGLLMSETFMSANIGKKLLVSTNIEAYDASKAKIIDTRSEKELEAADVAEITSLEDMADAKLAEYVVEFAAVVDCEDEIVKNVFITGVYETEDSIGGGSGGTDRPITLAPGTGVLPAGAQRPENLVKVTRLGAENITFDTVGVVDRALLTGYMPKTVGEWVQMDRQGEGYSLTKLNLKIMEGIITSNEACGQEYTVVSHLGGGASYFNVVTGLDMLGRYVRVYYESEYQNIDEPGLVYGIEDLGTTIRITMPEIDTKREFGAIFGAVYDMHWEMLTFDGRGIPTGRYIEQYDPWCYTAPKGTYVIYDGQIVSYLAPPTLRATKVQKVNAVAGNESITLVGYPVMSNTADDDIVVEYAGISKGDIVVVREVQGLYWLEKADMTTGKITRIAVNEYGENVITVAGTQYVQKNIDMAATGLTNSSWIDFERDYEVYTYENTYIGWRAATSAVTLSDVVYVLGGYEVETTDAYGNCVTNIYAQGVDMDGKELSVLVGIEYEAESMVDLGLINGWDISAGYYTFNLSADKDEKKAGIMVAEALEWGYDEEDPNLYVGCAKNDLQVTGKTTNIPTEEGEFAFLESDSRFVVIGGELGSELDTAVFVGGVDRLNVDRGCTLVLERDELGNTLLRALVVFAYPGDLQVDAVYVTEDQMQAVGQSAEGYLFEVYNAPSGTLREVTLQQAKPFAEPGFYSLEEVDWGVYAAQAYRGVWVKGKQEILNWQAEALTTTDLINCPVGQPVVLDIRSKAETEQPGQEKVGSWAELERLSGERYANCRVTVDVWRDPTTGTVGAIYVTQAQPRINGLYQYAYVYGTEVNETQQELEVWGVRAGAEQPCVLPANGGLTGLAAGLYAVNDVVGTLAILPGFYSANAPYYTQNTLAPNGFVLDDTTGTLPLADGSVAVLTEKTVFVTITGQVCDQAQVTVEGRSFSHTFAGRQVQVLLTQDTNGQPEACVVYLCRFGAGNAASGICGNGVSWVLTEDGTLRMSGGDGVIPDCEQAPWYSWRQSIKRLMLDGISYIGANAFADCTALTEVELPAGLIGLGEGAFARCAALVRAEFFGDAPNVVGQNVFADCAQAFVVCCPATADGWVAVGYDPIAVTWMGWPLRMESTYVIRHLWQKADATGYEIVWEQVCAGLSGQSVEIPEASYEGFAECVSGGKTSGVIEARGTLVLERCFDRESYTISFRGEDPVVESITARYGAPIELPSPRRYGYRFVGWYADEALTQEWTLETMPVNGTVLYPKWGSLDAERAVEYTIDRILFRDEQTKRELTELPDASFLVEVQLTNLSSTELDTVLLVSYTDEGQMLNMHYMYAASRQGDQLSFGVALDNTDGRIGKVKAFVMTYLGGQPLAVSLERS